MHKLYFIAFFSLLFFSCFGQFDNEYNYSFKTYTAKDGLVHNYTKKCESDSKGFLWIITQHGLSRFDGVQFKNFEHSNTDSTSLPENDLEDIAIDGKDNIWLSYRRGLCMYNTKEHRFKIIKNKNAIFLSQKIIFDKKRNCIWSVNSTSFSKIDCSDLSIHTDTLMGYTNLKNIVYPLMIDSKDRLWIPIGRRGYFTINLTTKKQFYFKEHIWPTHIYEDNDKNIWMSTWQSGFRKIEVWDTIHKHTIYGDSTIVQGINEYDFISYGATESKTISGNNIIWVIKCTQGILLFDKTKQKFVKLFSYDINIKDGIATDFNFFIYTDKNDIIWICTWHGLTKVNKKEQQFQSKELPYMQTQLYNCLSGIVDDPLYKNIAWIGINGSGIFKYDKNANKVIRKYFYDNKPQNYNWRWTESMAIDKYNIIWGTTYTGLIKISKGRVTQFPLGLDYINASTVKRSYDGCIWVTTAIGLYKIDDNKVTKYFDVRDSSENYGNHFYDVSIIDKGHLGVACERYAKVLTVSTGNFEKIKWNFNTLDSLEQMQSKCIEVIKNKMYIGTLAGLVMYDLGTKKSYLIGKEIGIDKIDIHRLQKDTINNLWIYTSSGLFKYNTNNGSFEKFTTQDGIYDLSEDPISFFEYNKKFHIGYRMAVTSFDPYSINVNTQKVYPYITEVFINRKQLDEPIDSFATNALNLTRTDNEISFNFSAPDFTNTDKITFSVQLQGFDSGWVQIGTKRSVTYNNLRPGQYVFKVKAANSSGLWNDAYKSFSFYIKPALWQRWWFWPLLALLFVSMVIFIARKRVATIRQKEQQKTAVNKTLAELETKMLRSQMNPHFIFNSLNSIQKYIWESKEEDAAEYLARFAKLMRAILENSRKELVLLKDEIEVMKLYIELEHRRSNSNFDYSIKLSEHIDLLKIAIPPLLMQPFIENAIWHGLNKKKEKGNLIVNVTCAKEQLVCIIDDDGVGRQAHIGEFPTENNSLGISITKQRINRLMETTKQFAGVSIEDKKENGMASGTRVTITLPLQNIEDTI